MSKRALYRIMADSADITALISDRFLSLTVTDVVDGKSDSMRLRLDNRDDKLQFPDTGAKLKIFMGLEGSLMDKGTFSIDEVTEGLEDGIIEVTGRAADMKGSIKATKDRTWEGPLTLGDLLKTIAGEHGYNSQIHPALAAIALGHLNQKAESDMNLLTRLCNAHGGVMKVGGGCLMAVPKEAAESAAGQPLAETVIDDPTESSGRVIIQERGSCAAVQASYFDEANQTLVNVVVKGEGVEGPTVVLKGRCKDAAEAKAKAEAHLRQQARGKATMTLNRPLSPEIIAPGKVTVKNHRQSANGVWFVSAAEHKIASGEHSGTILSLSTQDHEATKKKGK